MPETEFDCVDCGRHVVSFGYDPPGPARCVSCLWIRQHVPADQQTAVRQRLGVPLMPNPE
jgi:hypothetical protein